MYESEKVDCFEGVGNCWKGSRYEWLRMDSLCGNLLGSFHKSGK